MRGRRVERRFGWDTHGLPAELEAMSQLGIKTKEEILELGIETFNAKCRESVLRYTDDWRAYVTRQARWVDFDHDYKTLEPDYMESVIWAFKQLYDKGLVYEGFRVLPVLLERPDAAVQPRAADGRRRLPEPPGPGRDRGPASGDRRAGPGLDDHAVDPPGQPRDHGRPGHRLRRRRVRRDRHARALRHRGGAARRLRQGPLRRTATTRQEHVVERLKGTDLLGRKFLPPFDYYLGHPKAHHVFPAEFVTTEDGTGLVHTAGAFGEEDKIVTDAAGIEPVVPVGPDGRFTYPVTDYEGLLVFDANLPIIDHLKARDPRRGRPRRGDRRAPCCCAARPTTTRTRTAGGAASR